jgi:hypothetical protein
MPLIARGNGGAKTVYCGVFASRGFAQPRTFEAEDSEEGNSTLTQLKWL